MGEDPRVLTSSPLDGNALMDAQTKARIVTNTGIDILAISSRELLQELLRSEGHKLTDVELNQLMADANDNPWDAFVIWQLQVLAKELFSE